LGVHREADRGDLARLLAAQDVAGAADLQILRRDAESGAEVGELLDGRQPLARVGGQDLVARYQQIAEGQAVAAPHPAAQLVELRQSEPFSMIYKDRITCRNIDTVFDDGRG